MSERNSTPLPISGSASNNGDTTTSDLTDDQMTDGLDLGFDGAEDILRSWRRGMRPDPDLTVSEWADQHRKLSSRASAEPGQYRTARTPYLREIMDALSPRHPAQRISFMKAAQVGATEAGNNWIGFVIHHAPGPMLAVLPTVEMAKRTSRGRLDPLIAESPALRERVNPARSRDAGNSMLSKEFPGGILVLTGANSATGLRSMPARYIFLDEVDAYPASADEEGDPVTLAEARTTTFSHRRKVFVVSTPTIRGISRIEREYEASDQRCYFVPCGTIALAGAQAAIQLVPRLDAPGRAAVLAPSYNEHAAALTAQGWHVDAASDLDAIAGADLAVVVNPNNPDGQRWSPRILTDLAGKVGQLMVDGSFADAETGLSLAPRLKAPSENFIVMRSFGEFFGLAGVRLGFVLAGPKTAALADREWHRSISGQLHADAARLFALLDATAGCPTIGA
jgi:hypothetical protein